MDGKPGYAGGTGKSYAQEPGKDQNFGSTSSNTTGTNDTAQMLPSAGAKLLPGIPAATIKLAIKRALQLSGKDGSRKCPARTKLSWICPENFTAKGGSAPWNPPSCVCIKHESQPDRCKIPDVELGQWIRATFGDTILLTCSANSVPYDTSDGHGPGCGVPGGWVDHYEDSPAIPQASIPFWWNETSSGDYSNYHPLYEPVELITLMASNASTASLQKNQTTAAAPAAGSVDTTTITVNSTAEGNVSTGAAEKALHYNHGYWVRSMPDTNCKDRESCLCECFYRDGGLRFSRWDQIGQSQLLPTCTKHTTTRKAKDGQDKVTCSENDSFYTMCHKLMRSLSKAGNK